LATTFSKQTRIGIAGTGRAAQSIGRALRDRGFPVAAVAGRDPGRTQTAAEFIDTAAVKLSDLPLHAGRFVIAVSDGAIEDVAALLAQNGAKEGAALHTCGARGPDALAALAASGVSCGTLHPFQTLANPEQGAAALAGSAFAIDGEGEALEWAGEIVTALDGIALRIAPEARRIYHAAGVMASNYVAALLDASLILLMQAGVGEREALKALEPIVCTGVKTVFAGGPLEALTGPISRGDATTVEAHLQALACAPTSVCRLYRAAGLHALDMAVRRGLQPEAAASVERALGSGGTNGR
jgi:predicted short-subunit dehydrogenase-like oxidoreductase (DUF2520 family)